MDVTHWKHFETPRSTDLSSQRNRSYPQACLVPMFQKGHLYAQIAVPERGCVMSVERMFLLAATISFVVLVGATALLLVGAA
jgi:hypothetical protein